MVQRLSREFFNQPTIFVAQSLLGKQMVFENKVGIITETEAYSGHDDPACHAARGKTPRNAVMFGPPAFSYVYFIYGMYYCLNVVTEAEGFPAAVLIRGLFVKEPVPLLLNGPGKLCRHLSITREHNGIDLAHDNSLYIQDTPFTPPYQTTPRIGITQGQDKPWRFVVKDVDQF